jgi:hypothetical protein
MNKKILEIISEEDVLLQHINMSPSDRLKMCFGLSDWSIRFNKHQGEELNNRLQNNFILR